MPVNNYDNYPMTWKPIIKPIAMPIYKQLIAQLVQDVKTRVLNPGERMPPQRELADFLDVNLTTITRVYKKGEELGILSARVGKGTFISLDVNVDEQLLYNDQYQNIIQMATIYPPYNGNYVFEQVVKDLVNQPKFNQLLEYQSPNGTIHQREAVVNYLQNFSLLGKAQDLVITTGSQNALAGILIGLFKTGDRIAVTELTFSGLKSIAKMQGINLIPIPNQLVKEEFPCNKFLKFLVSEHIQGIYLVPEQNNPTTETLSEHARKNIAETVKKNGTILIEDSINRVFCDKKVTPIALLAPEQTIYIFSTSKFMAAGLRIAYVFVPEKQVSLLSATMYNLNLMVSPFNLEIVTRIIESPVLEEIIEEKKQELRRRDKLVKQILGELPIFGDATCCFRWLELPKGWSSHDVEQSLLQKGVKVFGSEKFTVGNRQPPKAIRISISSPKTKEELKLGLTIIRDVLLQK